MNNENEKYILHFIFHTLHFTYQISWIHVMNNNIKITYQLVRRQDTSYMRISKAKEYIQVYIDYLIEKISE